MSFQPGDPTAPQPPVGPPVAPPSSPPVGPPETTWSTGGQVWPGGAPPAPGAPSARPVEPPRRRGGRGLIVLGIVLLVLGIAGAVAAVVVGAVQTVRAVEDMARAPAGCTTELNVTTSDRLYVYVETKGTIGELRGGCTQGNRDYRFDAPPRVQLTLTDADGAEVSLDRTGGISYDTGDFVGTEVRSVALSPGTYRLTVDADDPAAVVAVGRSMDAVGAGAALTGVAIGILGVVLGLVLIVLGVRRRRRGRPTPPVTPTVTWVPSGPPASGTGWAAPAPGSALPPPPPPPPSG